MFEKSGPQRSLVILTMADGRIIGEAINTERLTPAEVSW